jgi:hypothetical protein
VPLVSSTASSPDLFDLVGHGLQVKPRGMMPFEIVSPNVITAHLMERRQVEVLWKHDPPSLNVIEPP